MAQAIRRKWAKTLPDGTRVVKQSKKWYAEYIDANGEQKRVPGYTDKGATEQLAARLEREASRDAEGLGDPCRKHRKRPLSEHLDDYALVLTGKGDTQDHVKLTTGRVRDFLSGCKFRMFDDVELPKASEWLTDLRRPGPVAALPTGVEAFTPSQVAKILDISLTALRAAVKRHRLKATGAGRGRRLPRASVQVLLERANPGRGPTTVNHYIRAVRGFFRWMVEEKRASSNPLAGLTMLNERVEIRRGRRELPADELQALFAATRASQRSFRGLTGEDRFFLYLTAATTGFRANALENLTPGDFDLDAGYAVLPARFNKSRKVKEQPIPGDVVEQLRAYLKDKPEGSKIWGGTWAKDHRGAEMMRIDLEAASIPYAVEGPDGPEYADFHALRHSYLTLGGRSGIDLRTLQELAGHSTSKLTERYSHRRLHDLAGAVKKIPSLLPPADATFTPKSAKRGKK